MIKNFKGPLLLAFLFMIVLIAPSCKKDSNEPQPQPPTTPTNKDTLTKTDTTPVPKRNGSLLRLPVQGLPVIQMETRTRLNSTIQLRL